ncbi:hypothetical protein NLI96_g6826 [Meripilus lineatus]|uniref:Fe2OG dioxygenase domain-containing protein n=1 Tax=Meripilus lineatus TaxID=2056292 RepID=A0AAD5V2I2_9APHY|nr:hypothetical protein NLI96_g6826 [Physisporinus lineatus]
MASACTHDDAHNTTSPTYKKAKKRYLKTIGNRPQNQESDWTPFRAAEKKFKARFPPPDLSRVLDLAVYDDSRATELARGGWGGAIDCVEHRAIPLLSSANATKSVSKVAFTFPSVPGLIEQDFFAQNPIDTLRLPGLVLLPGYLSHQDQRDLVRWSLRDHARYPNETNLDTHYLIPETGLWDAYLHALQDVSHPDELQPKASSIPIETVPVEKPGPRQLISNEAADKNNYLELSSTAKLPPPPSLTVKPASPISLLPKLRWANIGWYYHWSSKQYDFARGKIEVSEVIKGVCQRAVGSVDWEEVYRDDQSDWGPDGPGWKDWQETYEPDAGIVNFYQTKDTLMAHVDRSEVCATSPLVSISLGCAAIFLIGGDTRDTEPIPILLRSGDVVIMSGPGCRRAYHGVPRILENTLPPHFDVLDEDPQDWKFYQEYLRTTRVNINVRQVFPKDFDPQFESEGQ